MLDQPDVVPGLAGRGQREFTLVRRGYHPEQVLEVIADLDGQIADLSHALSVAELRAVEAESRSRESEALLERGRPTFDSLGGRVAQMLSLAEAEAAELREQAQAESAQRLDGAQSEAGRLRSEAAAEAGRLRSEAAAEADQVRYGAAGEAEALRHAAQEDSDALLSQARHDAARVREEADRDAEMRLALAAQHLEALELRRDDALRSVQVIRDNLNRVLETGRT